MLTTVRGGGKMRKGQQSHTERSGGDFTRPTRGCPSPAQVQGVFNLSHERLLVNPLTSCAWDYLWRPLLVCQTPKLS